MRRFFAILACLCFFGCSEKLISLDKSEPHAQNSKIHSGKALLYKGKKYVIAINAGHGTKGAEKLKTLSNPLGLPKATNGTSPKNAIYSLAISQGAKGYKGGFSEAELNLKVAIMLKEKLLKAGYGVLMLREDADVQLDNIARTLIANKYADIHIAIHFDDTSSDNGAFCMSSQESAFLSKELNAKNHALCEALLAGFKESGLKVKSKAELEADYKDFASYDDGKMYLELTQSAYSSVPNTDIELGDKASDTSGESLERLADALALGVEKYLPL